MSCHGLVHAGIEPRGLGAAANSVAGDVAGSARPTWHALYQPSETVAGRGLGLDAAAAIPVTGGSAGRSGSSTRGAGIVSGRRCVSGIPLPVSSAGAESGFLLARGRSWDDGWR